MGTVYLDSSALGGLFTSRQIEPRLLLRLRRRLSSRLWSARPRVVVGPQIVSELSQSHDLRFRAELVDFLRRLPDPLFLKSAAERVREEVVAAAAGSEPDVFLDDDERYALLWLATEEAAMWRAELQFIASGKKTFLDTETAARAGLLHQYGGQAKLAAFVQRWFATGQRERLVEEWARDSMRRLRKDFGLPSDQSAWPDPKQLPTVWAETAFKLARIYLVNKDGRRLDPNDFPDRGHYMNAAHADTLIVEDAKFRAIAAECPPPKPHVISFTEWAKLVLG